MTVAARLRAIRSPRNAHVMIAGVPWPLHKVISLVAGFTVLAVASTLTASAAAVSAATAVATVLWVLLGIAPPSHSRHDHPGVAGPRLDQPCPRRS